MKLHSLIFRIRHIVVDHKNMFRAGGFLFVAKSLHAIVLFGFGRCHSLPSVTPCLGHFRQARQPQSRFLISYFILYIQCIYFTAIHGMSCTPYLPGSTYIFLVLLGSDPVPAGSVGQSMACCTHGTCRQDCLTAPRYTVIQT